MSLGKLSWPRQISDSWDIYYGVVVTAARPDPGDFFFFPVCKQKKIETNEINKEVYSLAGISWSPEII